jgi:hypothetical protein
MRKKPRRNVASAKGRARSVYEATKDLCGIAETSDPGLSAYRVRPRLVVTRESGEKILEQIRNPKPTKALRRLMRD